MPFTSPCQDGILGVDVTDASDMTIGALAHRGAVPNDRANL
jgi:hypothetical protein